MHVDLRQRDMQKKPTATLPKKRPPWTDPDERDVDSDDEQCIKLDRSILVKTARKDCEAKSVNTKRPPDYTARHSLMEDAISNGMAAKNAKSAAAEVSDDLHSARKVHRHSEQRLSMKLEAAARTNLEDILKQKGDDDSSARQTTVVQESDGSSTSSDVAHKVCDCASDNSKPAARPTDLDVDTEAPSASSLEKGDLEPKSVKQKDECNTVCHSLNNDRRVELNGTTASVDQAENIPALPGAKIDVLYGAQNSKASGNVLYNDYVEKRCMKYREGSRLVKESIIDDIEEKFRFLGNDNRTNLGARKVRRKIEDALRRAADRNGKEDRNMDCTCWKCASRLDAKPVSQTRIQWYASYFHPLLKCPTCSVCVEEIEAVQLDKEATVCAGCAAKEGVFLACDGADCQRDFCLKCVAKAHGDGAAGNERAQQLSREDGDWLCMVCEPPEPLVQLQLQAQQDAKNKADQTCDMESCLLDLRIVEAEKKRCLKDLDTETEMEQGIRAELLQCESYDGDDLDEMVAEEVTLWKDRLLRHKSRLDDWIQKQLFYLHDKFGYTEGTSIAFRSETNPPAHFKAVNFSKQKKRGATTGFAATQVATRTGGSETPYDLYSKKGETFSSIARNQEEVGGKPGLKIDVLYGSQNRKAPGNQLYNEYVVKRCMEYRRALDKVKESIIDEILEKFRFLGNDNILVLEDRKVRQKIQDALRHTADRRVERDSWTSPQPPSKRAKVSGVSQGTRKKCEGNNSALPGTKIDVPFVNCGGCENSRKPGYKMFIEMIEARCLEYRGHSDSARKGIIDEFKKKFRFLSHDNATELDEDKVERKIANGLGHCSRKWASHMQKRPSAAVPSRTDKDDQENTSRVTLDTDAEQDVLVTYEEPSVSKLEKNASSEQRCHWCVGCKRERCGKCTLCRREGDLCVLRCCCTFTGPTKAEYLSEIGLMIQKYDRRNDLKMGARVYCRFGRDVSCCRGVVTVQL
jgi:hypothetical protein